MARAGSAAAKLCLLLALAGLPPAALARASDEVIVNQSLPHHPLEDQALNEPESVLAKLPTLLAKARKEHDSREVALLLLTGALLFVLAVFYILQRRSNQRISATLARLRESEAQAEDLLNLSAGFVFLHDLDGRLMLVNPAAALALGHSPESLVGRQLQEFQPRAGRNTFSEYLAQVQNEGADEGVFLVRSGQGDHRHWRYSSRLSAPKDGRAYVVGNAVDVTDQVQHTRALHEKSMRDALTGSYNRRHLERFENEHPGRRTWGAITVDLDHFKQVNDQLGHDRGDQVLIEFAAFLTERVRFGDAVVRLGGDEFLVLLADADQHTLDATSARLLDDAADAPCAFTLGGALRQPGETLGATISRADAAMYARRAAERGGSDA